MKVLKEAVSIHGKSEILNSDQGYQFTCKEYIDYLKANHIQIRMDGKGRALDNIYIEKFWRTIKYQYINLNPAQNGLNLYQGIRKWFERYHNRDHQEIDKKKPAVLFKNAA